MVDQLAGDDAGCTLLAHGMHVGRRQRAAFDEMAVVLDAADGIECEIAIRDRRKLLLDDGLATQLIGEALGREHERRIEVDAFRIQAPGDFGGALVRPVGIGRAEIVPQSCTTVTPRRSAKGMTSAM